MEYFLLFVLLLIGYGIYVWRSDGGFKPPGVSPISKAELRAFERAPSLFVNANEAGLFNRLRDRLPSEYHIHGKVRLEDIIRVKHKGLPEKASWAARGRVKSRHVDYLITNRAGHIILAIELDGRAHDPKNPSEADKVKTALFNCADVPLRRILVGEDFDLIADTIVKELNRY